jgi:hypothetical protein
LTLKEPISSAPKPKVRVRSLESPRTWPPMMMLAIFEKTFAASVIAAVGFASLPSPTRPSLMSRPAVMLEAIQSPLTLTVPICASAFDGPPPVIMAYSTRPPTVRLFTTRDDLHSAAGVADEAAFHGNVPEHARADRAGEGDLAGTELVAGNHRAADRHGAEDAGKDDATLTEVRGAGIGAAKIVADHHGGKGAAQNRAGLGEAAADERAADGEALEVVDADVTGLSAAAADHVAADLDRPAGFRIPIAREPSRSADKRTADGDARDMRGSDAPR